jgi:hypothetical protein
MSMLLRLVVTILVVVAILYVLVTFLMPFVILPSLIRRHYEPELLEGERKEAFVFGGEKLCGYSVRKVRGEGEGEGEGEGDNGRWIIFFPGNGALAADTLTSMRMFAERFDANVVCIDYRGVGSSGAARAMLKPTQLVADARAVIDHVFEEFNPTQVVLYGHSLGGMVARAAGNTTKRKVGVCSDRSFTSLRSIAERIMPKSIVNMLVSLGYDMTEGPKGDNEAIVFGNVKDEIIPPEARPEPDIVLQFPSCASGHNTPMPAATNWKEASDAIKDKLFCSAESTTV